MNILFITDDIYPHTGGIERVTDIQVRLFTEHGHACFAVYRTGDTDTPYKQILKVHYTDEQRYRFTSEFAESLSKQTMNFAKHHQIDLIINTRDWPLFSTIARQTADSLNIKHINYIHHQIFDRSAIRRYITSTPHSLKRTLKKNLFPLYWLCFRRKINRNYRLLYQQCDAMVILSEGFREAAIKELTEDRGEKLAVIANPIVFAPTLDIDTTMQGKEKKVLIVGRMDEVSKNISGALRIWAAIEKHLPQDTDWTLDIVGDGPDRENYELWVKNQHLQHVRFHGHIGDLHQLADHYRRASIFMMTSHFEGFGMTLIEAQSFGCIPLAFDNFAALYDIIKPDLSNGLIIPSNNYHEYIRQLEFLIDHPEKRQEMGIAAIQSCNTFSRENHYRRWMELIATLGIDPTPTHIL